MSNANKATARNTYWDEVSGRDKPRGRYATEIEKMSMSEAGREYDRRNQLVLDATLQKIREWGKAKNESRS